MTSGLQVILLPNAHAATGLRALPATSVTLMRVPLTPPTHLQKNVLRVLFLLNEESCSPTPPTHHSRTQHGPQEREQK